MGCIPVNKKVSVGPESELEYTANSSKLPPSVLEGFGKILISNRTAIKKENGSKQTRTQYNTLLQSGIKGVQNPKASAHDQVNIDKLELDPEPDFNTHLNPPENVLEDFKSSEDNKFEDNNVENKDLDQNGPSFKPKLDLEEVKNGLEKSENDLSPASVGKNIEEEDIKPLGIINVPVQDFRDFEEDINDDLNHQKRLELERKAKEYEIKLAMDEKIAIEKKLKQISNVNNVEDPSKDKKSSLNTEISEKKLDKSAKEDGKTINLQERLNQAKPLESYRST